FFVNWFLKDDQGDYLWPGYGENSRVLKWVFQRCAGEVDARDTPVGLLPTDDSLDLTGLTLSDEARRRLLYVDAALWRREIASLEAHYAVFGKKLPHGLHEQLDDLRARLAKA